MGTTSPAAISLEDAVTDLRGCMKKPFVEVAERMAIVVAKDL